MFSAKALALAPWSVSKVKLARTCPFAFRAKYIDRIPEDRQVAVSRIGVATHQVLDRALGGEDLATAVPAAEKALRLTPAEAARARRYVPGILAFLDTVGRFRAGCRVVRELREEKLGLTVDLVPTSFGAKDVFFRGVWDMGFVLADGRVAIIDHKTGRRGDMRWHDGQLRSYAVMALSHFPALTKVWPAVHFVGEAEVVWPPPIAAGEIRSTVAAWFEGWINEAAERVGGDAEHEPLVSNFCAICGYLPRCPRFGGRPAEERPVALSARRPS